MQDIRSFHDALFTWFDAHGRKHLPWQVNQTPYRVWVSEIMLQQTQVATVIPYFERFMDRFPTVYDLAAADIDEVLSYWAGLGYYARGRNLHACAKRVVSDFNGEFPDTLADITSLPGIGQSTGGAILSLAFKQPVAILDGNVKRVLARLYAVEGYVDDTDVKARLWQLAERLLSEDRPADYTQAMMDMGAMICTRTKPLCQLCPFSSQCEANQQQTQLLYPKKRKKKPIPQRSAYFFVVTQSDKLLLQRRPDKGIWGGLWCLPSADDTATYQDFLLALGCADIEPEVLPTLSHTFTHFKLTLQPVLLALPDAMGVNMPEDTKWLDMTHLHTVGLPAPIERILIQIMEDVL